MKIFKYSLLFCITVLLSFESNAQGVISRPTKSTKNIKKASKKIIDEDPLSKISEPDGYINGHGYVDLGLASGLKWANCNIGSLSPEDDGNYYSWGETSTKNVYSKLNSRTYDKTKDTLQLLGFINSNGILKPSYDIANEEWGNNWRIPTQSECQELIEKCSWSWLTTKDGICGYSVIGPNKKNIFIPIGGYKDGSDILNLQKYGYYWTSSVSVDENAWSLLIDQQHHLMNISSRYLGFSVRPVINDK